MSPNQAMVLAIGGSHQARWFFALFVGGRLAHGLLRTGHDDGPRLRDPGDHVHGRVADLVIAVPDTLDHDDLRAGLRRVPGLATARIRIYTVTAHDIAAALNLPAPSDGESAVMRAVREAAVDATRSLVHVASGGR